MFSLPLLSHLSSQYSVPATWGDKQTMTDILTLFRAHKLSAPTPEAPRWWKSLLLLKSSPTLLGSLYREGQGHTTILSMQAKKPQHCDSQLFLQERSTRVRSERHSWITWVALLFHKTTKYAQPFLITCPWLHTPLGTCNGKSSEMKADKSLQKQVQLETALPGTSSRAVELQIKLSKMAKCPRPSD